ncbi:MAG: hypothetical protein ACE5HV_10765 [Acidobacteriota bacterium]
MPPTVPKPKLKLAKLGELFERQGKKPLSDQSLPFELARAEIGEPFTFKKNSAPKLDFSVSAGGKAAILAFNNEDDVDPDGILRKKEGKRTEIGDLPPQIELSASGAWLKYGYEADIKGAQGVSLDQLGFAFDADKKLAVADYRRHDRSGIVFPAVLSDLAHPRFALRKKDILSLKADECLSMQFIGTVAAKVELKWADIFSSQFGNLATLLNTDDVIPIKVSSGLTISSSVSLKDDFIVAFSRVNRTRLRVALRKAKQRKASYSFESSVEVEFGDTKELQKALESVVEGVLGEPYARIEGILKKNALSKLSPAQRKILEKVLAQLGVDASIPNKLEELRERIADLKKKVQGTIERIAKEKITAGFKYEYSRISTHTSLLQATIPVSLLNNYHADLIKGRLETLLKALRDGKPGIKLETYLNRKTLATSKAWGFTLGIGSWSVYGKDRERIMRTVDENIHGQKKVAYHGLRSYEAKWIGEDFAWTLDFKADMESFSMGLDPTIPDYRFGLSLVWERRERLSEKVIRRLIDTASLWQVCSPKGFNTIFEKLRGSLGKRCDITVQMRIDDELFSKILPAMGSASQFDFCDGLGAAMPWMKDYKGRRILATRRTLYSPMWRYYFEHPTARVTDLAKTAAHHLRKVGYSDLYPLELEYSFREPFTFAGLVRLNGNTIVDIEGFIDGMRLLHDGVVNQRPDHGLIERAFGKIEGLGRQSHHIRALGVYANDLINQQSGMSGIERTLTVDNGADTYIFGM